MFLQILTFDTGLLLVAPVAKVGSAGPESLDAPRGGDQHPVAEQVARVVRVDQGSVILKTLIKKGAKCLLSVQSVQTAHNAAEQY